MKKLIFILFIICLGKLYAVNPVEKFNCVKIETQVSEFKKPNPTWILLKKKQKNRKKAIAAVLAFPLPFGVIGLHRIYLGTKPYVPLVYIGTIGGAFGILPFIDFCVILLDKDTEHYKENSHIFMWIENQNKKKETEKHD